MAETVIETARIILRTEAPSDFDLWMAEINTPQVREYLRGVETPERVRETFDKAAKSQRKEGFSFWFIEDRANSRLLGCAGLKRADSDKLMPELRGELEIGWLLRQDAWGRGLASEAAHAAMAYAFAQCEAERVISLTSRSNTASWRIMEKLGMSYRPEWDFTDPAFPPRDNPTIIYQMTRKDWEEIR